MYTSLELFGCSIITCSVMFKVCSVLFWLGNTCYCAKVYQMQIVVTEATVLKLVGSINMFLGIFFTIRRVIYSWLSYKGIVDTEELNSAIQRNGSLGSNCKSAAIQNLRWNIILNAIRFADELKKRHEIGRLFVFVLEVLELFFDYSDVTSEEILFNSSIALIWRCFKRWFN